MRRYVNDIHVNVFEVAWLSEAQIKRFKSDFRVVANFFVQKRKHADYVPDDETEIEHVDAVLKLLSVMTGDNRYEDILKDKDQDVKEVHTMCDVAERLVNKGRAEGIAEGKAEGKISELAELVHDGDLKFETAAKKAEDKYHISTENFRKMVDNYKPDV